MSTPPRIAAIPTTYKGVKFRSKLEAAWAEWFDSKGIEWTYEQEGYQLPSGTWYLPDFWLPGARVFVEVKGILDESIQKPIELARSVPPDIRVVLAEAPAGSKYSVIQRDGNSLLDEYVLFRAITCDYVSVRNTSLDKHNGACHASTTYSVKCRDWEGKVCKSHLFDCLRSIIHRIALSAIDNRISINNRSWKEVTTKKQRILIMWSVVDSLVPIFEVDYPKNWSNEDPRKTAKELSAARFKHMNLESLGLESLPLPIITYINNAPYTGWVDIINQTVPLHVTVNKTQLIIAALQPWPGYLWCVAPHTSVKVHEDKWVDLSEYSYGVFYSELKS